MLWATDDDEFIQEEEGLHLEDGYFYLLYGGVYLGFWMQGGHLMAEQLAPVVSRLVSLHPWLRVRLTVDMSKGRDPYLREILNEVCLTGSTRAAHLLLYLLAADVRIPMREFRRTAAGPAAEDPVPEAASLLSGRDRHINSDLHPVPQAETLGLFADAMCAYKIGAAFVSELYQAIPKMHVDRMLDLSRKAFGGEITTAFLLVALFPEASVNQVLDMLGKTDLSLTGLLVFGSEKEKEVLARIASATMTVAERLGVGLPWLRERFALMSGHFTPMAASQEQKPLTCKEACWVLEDTAVAAVLRGTPFDILLPEVRGTGRSRIAHLVSMSLRSRDMIAWPYPVQGRAAAT